MITHRNGSRRQVPGSLPAAALAMLCAAGLALPTAALAEPQETIGLQGRLVAPTGAPVPDGDYGITVNFYKNKTDEKPLYTDVKPGVKVVNGLFSVQVGSVTPLNVQAFKSGDVAWVGVQVGSEPELPRSPVQYIPYAFRAQVATALQCTGCITAEHLAAEVLKPFAKGADLAAVATSGLYKDLKGLHMHVKLPFVIATSPGEYFSVYNGWFKRRTLPKI